tara:strand:+ start:1296 stop:2219 length:924 start_codon:yes stop_codon:yes gene_type:complete
MQFELEATSGKRAAFNRKTNARFNWSVTVPWTQFGFEFDTLDMTTDFMSVTPILQEAVGVEADGLIGIQTLQAISDAMRAQGLYWNPYNGDITCNLADNNTSIHFVKWNELDVPVVLDSKCAGIKQLDLHPSGNFTKSDRKLDSIIVHWGGLDPEHLHRVFSNRKASSHFGIGLNSSGEAYAAQYIDIAHVAWHAKGANATSIGIDICQQPLLKWLGHYTRKGYNVKIISNPATGYGPEKILSLDPRIAALTSNLLQALTRAFDIPKRFAQTVKLVEKPWAGILGHSNVDTKGQGKWDIAPWWNDIQ